MNKEKKIKDCYANTQAPSTFSKTLLKKWNRAINKRPSTLTVEEMAMFLRQQHFLDIVLPQAIEKLKEDPVCGRVYRGELIHGVSLVHEYDLKTKQELRDLIRTFNAQEILDQLTTDFEVQQFKSSMNLIQDKLKA